MSGELLPLLTPAVSSGGKSLTILKFGIEEGFTGQTKGCCDNDHNLCHGKEAGSLNGRVSSPFLP